MKKLTAVFALTLFLAACHHSKTSTMCYDDTCAAETGEIVYIVTNNTPVLFAFDSTEINAHFNSQLDQIAQMALQNDSTEVLIKGYTDDVGGNSYNFALSARRANAVANALARNIFTGRSGCSRYNRVTIRACSMDTQRGSEKRRSFSCCIRLEGACPAPCSLIDLHPPLCL